jgi:hypothetical protein
METVMLMPTEFELFPVTIALNLFPFLMILQYQGHDSQGLVICHKAVMYPATLLVIFTLA